MHPHASRRTPHHGFPRPRIRAWTRPLVRLVRPRPAVEPPIILLLLRIAGRLEATQILGSVGHRGGGERAAFAGARVNVFNTTGSEPAALSLLPARAGRSATFYEKELL